MVAGGDPIAGRASHISFPIAVCVGKSFVRALSHHRRIVPVAMPKKGESALARAERLQQEGLRLRRKVMHEAINSGLKRRPEFISRLYDSLDGMMKGVGDRLLMADGSVCAAVGESSKAFGVENTTSYAKKEPNEEATETKTQCSASSAAGDDGVVLMSKTLGDSKAVELQAVLVACEKVVFAQNALKGLRKEKQRAVPKGPLLEVLEYITGFGPSHPVDLSDAEAMSDFCEKAKVANNLRGRRGVSLPLPPDWKNDGVYRLLPTMPGDQVRVQMVNGVVRLVPSELLAKHDVTKLYVENNYSEKAAALRCHGGVLDISVQLLFAHESLTANPTEPSPKKQKTSDDSGFMAQPVLPPSASAALHGCAKDEAHDGEEPPTVVKHEGGPGSVEHAAQQGEVAIAGSHPGPASSEPQVPVNFDEASFKPELDD